MVCSPSLQRLRGAWEPLTHARGILEGKRREMLADVPFEKHYSLWFVEPSLKISLNLRERRIYCFRNGHTLHTSAWSSW